MVGVLHAAKSKLLRVCLLFYAVLEGSRGVSNATLFTIENKTRDRSSLVKDGKDGNGSNHNLIFFKLSHLHVVLKQWPKILYEWLFLQNVFFARIEELISASQVRSIESNKTSLPL